MRTTALTLCCLFAFACSSGESPGRGTTPGPKPVAGPEVAAPSIAALPQSHELAGQAIVERKDGPWTLRTTAASRNRGFDAAGADASGGMSPPGAPTPDGAVHESAGRGDGGGPATTGDELSGPAGESPAESAGSAPPVTSPAKGATDAEDREDEKAAPAQGGSPLKAGSTDDNADFAPFLEFLAKWGDRKDTAGQYDELDVSDRRFLEVVNREGKPVPAAVVQVIDEAADRVVFTGTTYGDGRVPFYPKIALAAGTVSPAAEGIAPGLVVEATRSGVRSRTRWDMKGKECRIVLDVPHPVTDPIRLDVLFLIDTTGSMGDEIQRIKESLLGVTKKLRGLDREFDLRYAAVLYRDLGDAYVTMAHPFTGDIEAFDAALKSVAAAGGGDEPESLNQGLAEAVGRADWRPDAAKVMFLVADAPPHMDYQGDVRYGETVKAAVARGIRIHSVAASGLNALGTLVFRQIAQFTRGKFIFIQYGTIEATAKSHGVNGAVKSNNLDDIIFAEISDEIAHWGR